MILAWEKVVGSYWIAVVEHTFCTGKKKVLKWGVPYTSLWCLAIKKLALVATGSS